MKIKTAIIATAVLLTAATQIHAQAPEGYTKGTVTLAGGSTVEGYIKDNIKKNAAISFVDNNGGSKKQFEGSQINGAVVDGVNYTCIRGDFFKMVCSGKICFLQKASNAANKASYNGAEAVFNSGTEGKIGDYFVYSGGNLKHITKKTVQSFIDTDLAGCQAAVEKAKSINGDIPALEAAITVYNNTVK